MVYLLTAIGVPPGGSSIVHIYTQTVHRTTQNKQYIEQQKILRTTQNWKSASHAPTWQVIPWHFSLQPRKKHGETSVRVAEQ
jgi:hypothetical protein